MKRLLGPFRRVRRCRLAYLIRLILLIVRCTRGMPLCNLPAPPFPLLWVRWHAIAICPISWKLSRNRWTAIIPNTLARSLARLLRASILGPRLLSYRRRCRLLAVGKVCRHCYLLGLCRKLCLPRRRLPRPACCHCACATIRQRFLVGKLVRCRCRLIRRQWWSLPLGRCNKG